MVPLTPTTIDPQSPPWWGLHLLSDLAIGLAYAAIAATLALSWEA